MDHKDAVPQHKTNLAVWDFPSPVIVSRSAKMKVGAKCSADCQLTDHEIEIQDQAGARVARATLSAEPWPGTNGLYWAELEFMVPAITGTHTWTVNSPHGEAFSNFTFIAVKPPEHTVTIQVCAKVTQAPLPEVEVRLGVYRATTNEHGLAVIEVAGGNYSLIVWRVGYENFSRALEVNTTHTLNVEISLEPEAEQPYWM